MEVPVPEVRLAGEAGRRDEGASEREMSRAVDKGSILQRADGRWGPGAHVLTADQRGRDRQIALTFFCS